MNTHKPLSPLTARQHARYRTHVQVLDNCWLWRGYLDEFGRARFKMNGFRYIAARIAYYLFHGVDPGEYKVLHKCDNPACINPEHLWLGSQQDNIADMNIKGRHGRTGAKGNLQPHAKLNPTLVRYIRVSEMGPTALARELGVSQSLITMVRQQKVWSHVS